MVHRQKPTIAALLLNSELISYESDTLTVKISDSAEGLITKNEELIEDALFSQFQKDIRIRFQFTESDELQAVEKEKALNKKELNERLEKIKSKNQLIKNLFDEFDLEPI
jgi:hypothetical protein